MALPSLLPRQYRNDSIPKVAFHLLKSVGLLEGQGPGGATCFGTGSVATSRKATQEMVDQERKT